MARTYTIQGMDCPNCARDLENGVRRLPGIQHVEVNFAAGRMIVEGDVALEALRERVESLGKRLLDESAPSSPEQPLQKGGALAGFVRYLLAQTETQLALVGGTVIVLALLASFAGMSESIVNLLFILAALTALYPIARSGLRNLLINHDFNINLLMSIAAVGAIIIGETLEAATVIFLFAIGEALEGYNTDRARHSIRSLMSLAPAQAVRLRRVSSSLSPDKDGVIWLAAPEGPPPAEEIVPIEALAVGDIILVKPGERIAMDGVVTAGSSSADQASITGESMPVHKSIGSEVFAGSINGEGALEIRVTRPAADSTLSRIIQLVEHAQGTRAAAQRLIDLFARYYTPAVVAAAAVIAVIPPLFFGAPFHDVEGQPHGWLYRALTLLVIACPCALVISTPVTIISAITAAARRGVLIKGGVHLEALGQIRALAFDKTGTLTHGKPVVSQTRSVECSGGDSCENCDDLLALAAAVERRSTHPLARAIVQAAEARGVDRVYSPAESVAALAGRGIQGYINGRLVTVGSHQLFDEQHPHSAALCRWVEEAEARGETTVLLSSGSDVRGFIAVNDEARAASRCAIGELNALGLKTVMLTGDNAAAAARIAHSVDIQDVRAELLPGDKAETVKDLIQKYGCVGMVGDGINDTPALAAATVGIAMGGAGSAQALETADITLMADDLEQLPFAIRLARFSRRLIAQNIGLSLVLKLAFVLLALMGEASLWAAVLADVGMSLIVILNGMRPLRMAPGSSQTIRPSGEAGATASR